MTSTESSNKTAAETFASNEETRCADCNGTGECLECHGGHGDDCEECECCNDSGVCPACDGNGVDPETWAKHLRGEAA